MDFSEVYGGSLWRKDWIFVGKKEASGVNPRDALLWGKKDGQDSVCKHIGRKDATLVKEEVKDEEDEQEKEEEEEEGVEKKVALSTVGERKVQE